MRGRSRIVFLVGLVLGLIVFVTAVPLLVPVDKVRAGVERLLSSYVGETLRLTGPGVVRLFPGLEVEFRDVEARAADGDARVMRADRVTLSFDLVQYLLGRGVIASVELLRPEFRAGPPVDILAMVTRRERLDRMRPASVAIRQGKVVFVEAGGAPIGEIVGLDADYAWQRPTGRMRLGATFLWRDQPVSVSLQGHGPKALISGEVGNLSLTLTTAAGRAAFAGQASVVDRLQLDGMLSLSAAHPLGLARWLASGDADGFDLAGATLDGRLRLAGNSATVAGAELKLGGAEAEGVLSVQWDGARPLVRGTMDFEALTVERGAAAALAPTLVQWAASPHRLRVADLDLRLSAERLRAETLEASQVAATLVVKDGQVSGQIAEARIAGGDVSARLTTQPQGGMTRLALDMTADRVDAGRAATVLGLSEPRGGLVSGEARIEATAAAPPAVVTHLTGRARLKGQALRFGSTPDWLIPTGGTTAALLFDTVALEATLGGTTINVTRLVADGPGPGLTLAGSVDILRGGLGLSGLRSLPVAGAVRQQALSSLKLGGTITAPVDLAKPAR